MDDPSKKNENNSDASHAMPGASKNSAVPSPVTAGASKILKCTSCITEHIGTIEYLTHLRYHKLVGLRIGAQLPSPIMIWNLLLIDIY